MRNFLSWIGIACMLGVFWMAIFGLLSQSRGVAVGAFAAAFCVTLFWGLFFRGAYRMEDGK